MAGRIIGFVIVSFVALVMILIGVFNLRSELPVGFYNILEPPEPDKVTDVDKWNKSHGRMWIWYGVVIELGFFLSVVLTELIANDVIEWLPSILGIVVPIIVMPIQHEKLKRLYYIGNKRI